MPKISIVDRNAREYQNWLGPESPDHLTPRSLSSELVLTHEWQPGHHVFDERAARWHQQVTSTGAGWVAPQAFGPVLAAGYLRWILAASMWTGSSKSMVIALHSGAMGIITNGTPVAYGSATVIWLTRLLLLPVSLTMSGSWSAAGAGETVDFELIYADYRCCEPLPRL